MMMKRYLLAFLLGLSTVATSYCYAEEPLEGLKLATAPINRDDMESIKRGAKVFATTCMTCHTLVYLRYDKVAQEAGITLDKMPLNVKTWPNGVTPPDLSLEASVRGVDWIYTYLHSFYKDPSRPTGVNNLVFPNAAMPAILAPYQGEQALVEHPVHDMSGAMEWYDALVLVHQGTMTPEQYDAYTADIVNFLAYAAEPYHADQHRIGKWVLAFLLFFSVLAYMLKKEYWKDVK